MISKEEVVEALKQVYDPELQLDVWTLGLIYEIIPSEEKVEIKMTLTTPFCPYGPMLTEEVENKIRKETGAKEVLIELVFEPPWQPTDELKAMLGV